MSCHVSYYIKLYHIKSYYIVSNYIIPYHIISYVCLYYVTEKMTIYQHWPTVTSYERHIIWHHRQFDCLFNNLLKLTKEEKKTSKPCSPGICSGNPPVIGGFPSQRASDAESVSMSWRHHVVGAWYRHDRLFRSVPGNTHKPSQLKGGGLKPR